MTFFTGSGVVGELVTAAFLNSTVLLDHAEVTSGTAASLTLNIPSGLRTVRVVGNGRSDAAGQVSVGLVLTLNGVDSGSQYRTQRGDTSGANATQHAATTVNAITAGYIGAADSLVGERGWVDVLLLNVAATRVNISAQGGGVFSSSNADSRSRWEQGIAGFGPAQTVELTPSSGEFMAGTRYDLLRA